MISCLHSLSQHTNATDAPGNTISRPDKDLRSPIAGAALARSASMYPDPDDVNIARDKPRSKESGFGGFPGPFELISLAAQRFFPSLERKIERRLTVPKTQTLLSVKGDDNRQRDDLALTRTRTVPYISFDARVGRCVRCRTPPMINSLPFAAC